MPRLVPSTDVCLGSTLFFFGGGGLPGLPWKISQWFFQVPVKGGRDYITPKHPQTKARTISGIFPANWVIIYYLPPFTGT